MSDDYSAPADTMVPPGVYVGHNVTITPDEVVVAKHTLPPSYHNEDTNRVNCSDIHISPTEESFKWLIEKAQQYLAAAVNVRDIIQSKVEAEIDALRNALISIDPDTSWEDHDRTARVMHAGGLRKIA